MIQTLKPVECRAWHCIPAISLKVAVRRGRPRHTWTVDHPTSFYVLNLSIYYPFSWETERSLILRHFVCAHPSKYAVPTLLDCSVLLIYIYIYIHTHTHIYRCMYIHFKHTYTDTPFKQVVRDKSDQSILCNDGKRSMILRSETIDFCILKLSDRVIWCVLLHW